MIKLKKGFIKSSQRPLFGHADVIGFGGDDFAVKEIDRNLANKLIIDNHYSGKVYNATYIHLGVFIGLALVGVLQYGYAMNPQSMASVVKNTEIDEYLELNRMWLDDIAPKNSESRALSYSIKYIKRKFPKIKWIQSFADERCKRYGVVYQAANFNYYGEHKSDFWELDGIVYHNSLMTRDRKLSKAAAIIQDGKAKAKQYSLRQFRYIYFINKRSKSECCLQEAEYPKHGIEVLET